jgi:hypothetical protein
MYEGAAHGLELTQLLAEAASALPAVRRELCWVLLECEGAARSLIIIKLPN